MIVARAMGYDDGKGLSRMAQETRQVRQKQGCALAAMSSGLIFCCAAAGVSAQDRGGALPPGELPTPPSSAREAGVTKDVYDLVLKSKNLVDANKCEEARKVLQEALRISPNFAGIYNALGYSYLKEDKFKEAEGVLIKGLDIDPLNVEILENLGSANYHLEHFDQAIVYYKQSLRLINNNDPQAADTYVNLGSTLAEKGSINEAVEYFRQAIKLKPDFPKAYNALARMYYNAGKFPLAAENAKRAIYYKSDYAMAYYHLGLSQLALGNRLAATEALQNSLKYENNPAYANDTRQLLKKMTTGEAGISNSNGPATTGATAEPSAARSAADVQKVSDLLNQKQWSQAEALLRNMIVQAGENAVFYNNLGFALVHQKSVSPNASYKNAIAAYKKAVQLQKGPFPSAYYNMGQAYRLLGDYASAEASFKSSIADAKVMRVSMPMAHNALGMLLKQRGALKEARC
jgi:tetratricopeptide (TPR) repeat protein